MSQNQWGRAFTLLIKIEGGNITNTLDALQEAWKGIGTNGPLEITFLDDQINSLYEKEQKTAKIIGFFAFMSIFVGCLGLFGLATFMTERRIKEIGIRKVLGASVGNILLLLSKDFGKLVMAAFVVAVPIAYIISNKWLEHFTYRIEVGPMIFIGAGLTVLIIALFSTGIRSLQAAMTNPADTIQG
ncbi:ABC transporter permease [Gracilimonas sp.]|uniref:ABC transporter permease n=1 Tax=Gracilimonas sp. TaxID=1974203 RepID=UPI002870F70E|nr:FtsX-like permease family protein [Gracilimonas sp.]